MLDLTTRYMGLVLKNPLIASSSSFTSNIQQLKQLEKNGISAVVFKSIFEEEIINEYSGLLEQNDEYQSGKEFLDYYDYKIRERVVDDYLQLIKDAKKEINIPVIASINCTSKHEWTEFAKSIEQAGADGIELNLFFMPTDEVDSNQLELNYLENIKRVIAKVKIPVAVKLGMNFTNLPRFIKSLCNAGVQGVVLFNRFIRPDVDIQKLTLTSAPLYSHEYEIAESIRWIGLLAKKMNCDFSASTGIHNGESLAKVLLVGAQTGQIASTIYRNGPDQVQVMLSELEEWMHSKGFTSVEQFRGLLSHNDKHSACEYERVQFMKYTDTKR